MTTIVTRFATFGVCLLVVLTTSCDVLNTLTELNVPITITFNPVVSNASMPHTGVPECTDLTMNSKFNDNKDKLKSATISDLSFQVLSYTGIPSSTDARYDVIEYRLKFDPSYGDHTEYLLGSFTNVSVAALMTSAQSIKVTDSALNVAVAQIKTHPKFCVISKYTLNGTTGTITSMTSEMKITFQLKVDAASAL